MCRVGYEELDSEDSVLGEGLISKIDGFYVLYCIFVTLQESVVEAFSIDLGVDMGTHWV